MIVRELVALLGIHTDMESVQKADGALEGLKQAAHALGTIFVSGLVATGLTKFVRMAADVEETTTLLSTVFGDSSLQVQAWASDTAAVVGRSEFKLRDFASKIGAVAAPLMGTGEATAQLSTDMAQLAVDLASVFNTTDDEALVALRAGLIGESEPLRRFGVNILDAQLIEFASSLGKSFKGMSQAEKMQLRYQFILKQTAIFQGNANRELQSFTNQSKFMRDRLADLGIKIGTVLLPHATRLVQWAVRAVDGFMKLARGTKIFETALIALGVVATAVGIKVLLPFAPAIAAAAALAAGIAGVIIVAEDLWQFFTGGGSVLGDVLASAGVDTDRVREAMSKLLFVGGQALAAVGRLVGQLAGRFMGMADGAIPSVADAIEWLGQKFNTFLDWVEPKLDALMEIDWDAKLASAMEFFNGLKDTVTRFMNSDGAGRLLHLLAALAGGLVGYKLDGIQGALAGAIGGAAIAGAEKPREAIGSQVGAFGGGLLGARLGSKLGLVGGLAGGAIGTIGGGLLGRLLGSGSGGVDATMPAPPERNVNVTFETVATVNGTATAEQKAELERALRERDEHAARELRAAMLPSFAGKL